MSIAKRAVVVAVSACLGAVAIAGIFSPRDAASGLPTGAAQPAPVMDVDGVI